VLRFLTAGESHGPWLTAIVEGLPAGLTVDLAAINRDLRRRQGGYGRGGRMEIEQDHIEVLGGILYGRTTGAPVALHIENKDWANWRDRWASGDLPEITVPRPGHADYAGMVKYGLEDARLIAERASARETAARVAVGALTKQLLRHFDITVGSYVTEIGGVTAKVPQIPPEQLWSRVEASDVRCPDQDAAARMTRRIDEARRAGDSLGGVFVVMAIGVPIGLGSHTHWDRRLDARLIWAVTSIPAIKGAEVGPAFENARKPGTKVHDEFAMTDRGVSRRSNRAGGLEGGMTNGMPVIVRAAMKPIPTTVTPLRSVDLETGEPAETEYQRSDVCAVPAASIVGEAMVAWVLADALLDKLGGDSLEEMKAHAKESWPRPSS
jgi:chorismate synthase